MADQEERDEMDEAQTPATRKVSPKTIVLLVVVALFAGVIAAKVLPPRQNADGGSQAPAAASMTSVHNDAVADYRAAIKTGKPIYVLFHSLS